jgi:hypothetical protein
LNRGAGEEVGSASENLTRRANHQYIFIIARIQKARARELVAGFFDAVLVSNAGGMRVLRPELHFIQDI